MDFEAPDPPVSPPDQAIGASAALVRHFPPDVRAAYVRFCVTADPADADTVLHAVIRDHIPKKAGHGRTGLGDEVLLVADLGFDSIAVTEMIFFIEDLFQVSISNAEIVQVRTVGDLRAYMRRKLALQPPAAPTPAA
jgi:acyl carrier protein